MVSLIISLLLKTEVQIKCHLLHIYYLVVSVSSWKLNVSFATHPNSNRLFVCVKTLILQGFSAGFSWDYKVIENVSSSF